MLLVSMTKIPAEKIRKIIEFPVSYAIDWKASGCTR